MKPEILLKEQSVLQDTIKTVETQINVEQQELDDIQKHFYGSIEEKLDAIASKEFHLKTLNETKQKPYFARLDFKYDDEDDYKKLYVGKNGLIKDGKVIITDWRSPISSLYYDAKIGECSFLSPDGLITGDLKLKRQFEIQNQQLKEYYDVELVSNDELLQKYLNENNDSRLKSIVATIQNEQNIVIRRPINENIIIQGVAGSGKTTVALHRIAYLVYNYKDRIKQDQYLVLGPNPVFLKYIKSVLPDLDVSKVKQYTFETFTEIYIGEKIKLLSSIEKLNNKINGIYYDNTDRYKLSINYKNLLDSFIKDYYDEISNENLFLNTFPLINKNIIKKELNEAFNKFDNKLDVSIEYTKKRLIKYVTENKNIILINYLEYATKNNLSKEEMISDKKEISNYCKKAISKYFSNVITSASKLYRRFIDTIDKYSDEIIVKEIKEKTNKYLKKGYFDFEDLSSLLYIKNLIKINKTSENLKQLVIDEAQDYGYFNYYVLRKIFPNAYFSIFGDLAQSIYDYRGLESWEQINSEILSSNAKIINFNKSYRTTREIMQVADKIANRLGLSSSEMVIRTGPKVKYTKIINQTDYIIDKVNLLKQKGYNTIAIISKTDNLSRSLNNALKQKGLDIPNISYDDDLSDSKYKICTISNQLAKGLEFDAVIISDASSDIYDSNNKLDLKLLYVAVTRALHELDIMYTNDLTNALDW